MNKIMEIRELIYNVFHSSEVVFTHFRGDNYARYYTSMYLIADTSQAVWTHRHGGFSHEPMRAYLEFWGVKQATFMGRGFGDYNGIKFELWDAHTKEITYPVFNLRKMIEDYDLEASAILTNVLNNMRRLTMDQNGSTDHN